MVVVVVVDVVVVVATVKSVEFHSEIPHAVAVIVAVYVPVLQFEGISQYIHSYVIVLFPPYETQSWGCVSFTFITRLQLPYST